MTVIAVQLEDFGIIRFTSVPRGEAPLRIREQWIGVEVPCLFLDDGTPHKGECTVGVISGFQESAYPGFIVFQGDAIAALQKKSHEAARYWTALGFPHHEGALFLFDQQSAEIVTPVMTRTEFFKRYNCA